MSATSRIVRLGGAAGAVAAGGLAVLALSLPTPALGSELRTPVDAGAARDGISTPAPVDAGAARNGIATPAPVDVRRLLNDIDNPLIAPPPIRSVSPVRTVVVHDAMTPLLPVTLGVLGGAVLGAGGAAAFAARRTRPRRAAAAAH